MSDSYTKLFSSITESTVWAEPAGTRLVWITMLALVRRDGVVYASLPGLADRAKVTLEETITALKALSSPDQYSRTKEHEGRRIEEIDGGWLLLNHAKYASMRSSEERKEYMRKLMSDRRLAEKLAKVSEVSHTSTSTNTNTISEKKEQKKKHSTAKRGARIPDGFKPSSQSLAWLSRKRPDLDPSELTEAFRDYWESEAGSKATKLDWDKTWRNWARRQSSGVRNGKTQSKTMQGIQTLQAMKHGNESESRTVVPQLDFGGTSKTVVP